MIVNRTAYIDQLLRSKGNGLIKIVTGLRRSGKSFLLKTLFCQKLVEEGVREDHILTIDLENRKFKAFKDPDYLLDWVEEQKKDNSIYYVIIDEVQEVADFIINEMDRGVTAIYSQGWYSKEDTKVLLIVAYKTQLHQIVSAVKRIDPKAFVSVSTATSVYGEGFEEIKTGIKLKQKENGNA